MQIPNLPNLLPKSLNYMNTICTICGSESTLLMHKDGYPIWECPKCHLFFVYPQPKPEFLKEEVYSEKSGYQANKNKDLSKIKPTRKQKKLLKYLEKQPIGTFFDIGCSSGETMFLVQKLGYLVRGVELNPRTAAIAKENKLEVHVGTLADVHYVDKAFDYVFMGDLIEHVNEPVNLVKEAHRILKDNGQLIIITPNMQCFWAEVTLVMYDLFRIPWSAATPPHHLFQFSKKNLRLLAEQNGFALKKTWYTGAPSLKYELGSLHLVKRWKNKRTTLNFLFMFVSFSLYTVAYGINKIIELLPEKRFSMAAVFVKK